jgi:hypothetical protein
MQICQEHQDMKGVTEYMAVKIVHVWVQRIPLILPLLLRLSKNRILGRMVQIKNSITA